VIPKAAIWQELRKRALDTVQAGTRVPFASPPTLESWLTKGAYSVATVTNRSFVIHASAQEIGSALLSEGIFSADRAIEHAITLRNQLSTAATVWSSPAWTAITFYYWGYHLAVALTRILGRTTWFLSAETAALLNGLSPANTARAGAAPYTVQCGQHLSATMREVIVKRSRQTRAHDAVWALWHSQLRECASVAIVAKSSDPETRFYLTVLNAVNALGEAWPSDLRNALNYTNAVGYGAVRKKVPAAVFGSVAVDPPSTFFELITRLEANTAGLVYGDPLSTQVNRATRVLVDLTFAMDVLFNALLEDLLERRGIDRRWINQRVEFARSHSNSFNVGSWPCRDDNEAA
jgi:hypothetical protein